jgi:hypothetical protein
VGGIRQQHFVLLSPPPTNVSCRRIVAALPQQLGGRKLGPGVFAFGDKPPPAFVAKVANQWRRLGRKATIVALLPPPMCSPQATTPIARRRYSPIASHRRVCGRRAPIISGAFGATIIGGVIFLRNITAAVRRRRARPLAG